MEVILKEEQFHAIYTNDFSNILEQLKVKEIPFEILLKYFNVSISEFKEFVKTKNIINDFAPGRIGMQDGFYIEFENRKYLVSFQERGKVFKKVKFSKFEDLEEYIIHELYRNIQK